MQSQLAYMLVIEWRTEQIWSSLVELNLVERTDTNKQLRKIP